VMVKNCDIKEFYSGVKIEGTAGSHTTGNTVESVTIFDSVWIASPPSGGNGVACTYSDNARVRFSTIYNIDGSGLDVWECDNFTLEHSTLYDIGTETQTEGSVDCGTGNGIFIYGSKGASIDGNTFYDISQSAVLMWAMIADGSVDNTVSNNVIHDVGDRPCLSTDFGAISLSAGGDDIVISGNQVYNVSPMTNLLPAIGVDGNPPDPADEITIQNNELRDNGGGGIYFRQGATNVTISGNYIFRNSTDAYDPSTGYGIKTDGLGYSIDAECSYWGSYSGPTHGNNAGGTGDQVVEGNSGDVDYDPWIGKSGGTCDPNVAVKLYLVPASATVLEGDSMQVAVWAQLPDLTGAEMYAYQFQLNFETPLLEVTSASFDDSFFDPQQKAPGWQADYDNGSGWVRFAASLRTPSPGVHNGSGVLAYVTFHVKDAGYGNSDMTLTEVKLTDIVSDRITPEGTEWDRIEVLDTATVSGPVDLQGRANDSGAVVSFTNAGYPAFGASDTTDVDGDYDVRVPKATGWDITIEMVRYLDASAVGQSLGGDSHTLSEAYLLGGDANDDDIINILDLSAIGGKFGMTVNPATTAADINYDGVVNILDLVLAGGNYMKTESPWTP